VKITLPTIFGLMAAIGIALSKMEGMSPSTKNAGDILAVIGVAGTGFFSRQHNVSDEDAGAKPKS